MSSTFHTKEYATWLVALTLILFSYAVSGQEAEATANESETAEATETTEDTENADTLSESEETPVPKEIKPPKVYVAAKQGRLRYLQTLIEEGADVNASNASGRTALMGATFYRNKRIVEELLIEGADVNAKDNNGRTALMIAIRKKDPKIAALLLDAGADVTIEDNNKKTALMLVENVNSEELKKLIEAAKPSEENEESAEEGDAS